LWIVCGIRALKEMAIYAILKKVRPEKNTDDQHYLNPKKTFWTASLIASVAAAIEIDCCQCIKWLAATHGMSVYTIYSILHKVLGLKNKFARRALKLLSLEQKEGGSRPSVPPSSADP
jgi:hypothetical protein